MTDLGDWWRNIPPVTRVLFGLSMAVTVGANFGFADGYKLIHSWPLVVRNFEVWRLATSFVFWGRLSFQFLINMMFLYRYSTSLEASVFEGRRADYVFFVAFSAVVLLAVTAIVPLHILGPGLLSSIVYLWSRKHPDMVMSFMFGLRFKAIYLPFVLCAFKLLRGGTPIAEGIGILIGHLYYFLTDLYPLQSGRQLLKTPQLLYQWFPSPYAAQAQRAAQADPDAPPGRHAWGAGHRLN